MNISDTKTFLARVHLHDNRTVDGMTVAHWQQILHDVPLEDALAALVVHARDSNEYLVPAHIIRIVKRIRLDRTQRHDHGPDDRGQAPKPNNFEAMCPAASDPVAFARECAGYDRQLIAVGYNRTHVTNCMVPDTPLNLAAQNAA